MIDSLVAFGVLLVLILVARVPIAVAMLVVGFVGYALYTGVTPALAMVGRIAYDTGLTYEFSVLPLFILMGGFVNHAGFASDLYTAAHSFLGRFRGGLAMATVVASGGLAAISGSSLATAATMGKVAAEPMRRYGYADSLATGSIAAGGTLGIMIPPSVIMVIYGLITETSIGKLFVAGIIPGLLGVLGYTAVIVVLTWLNPKLGPAAEPSSWSVRLDALKRVWGVLALFLLVIGGIYGGAFTATEAAGIGAAGAFIFAVMRRGFDWRLMLRILGESARTTGVLFFILMGALIFANFVNRAGLPAALSTYVVSLGAEPLLVILTLVVIYVILGCLLESISMVLLTVPTFFPLIVGLGYDPIWFGIFVVLMVEVGLITPPVGLNLFVLRAIVPDVSTGTIIRGIVPFLYSDIFRLALLVFIPSTALVLPNLMGR